MSDPTSSDGNISQPPLLTTTPDIYHLQSSNSPCANSGNDSDAVTTWGDIDSEPRILGQHVDMGADETAGAPVYSYTMELTASPRSVCMGDTSTLTVIVRRGYDVLGRQDVAFTITGQPQGANASVSPAHDMTDPTAQTALSCDTPGRVTVQASATVEGASLQATAEVYFYDCQNAPDDWPMFMHDVRHTGMSSTWDVSGETLTRQWVVDLPTATTERASHYQPVWSIQVGQNTVYHPNPGGLVSMLRRWPPAVVETNVRGLCFAGSGFAPKRSPRLIARGRCAKRRSCVGAESSPRRIRSGVVLAPKHRTRTAWHTACVGTSTCPVGSMMPKATISVFREWTRTTTTS